MVVVLSIVPHRLRRRRCHRRLVVALLVVRILLVRPVVRSLLVVVRLVLLVAMEIPRPLRRRLPRPVGLVVVVKVVRLVVLPSWGAPMLVHRVVPMAPCWLDALVVQLLPGSRLQDLEECHKVAC